MAKLSFKERERQRREEEIIRTAARLIRERGFAHLNMDDIAEEVGVSKPTLYQHFKSKDDMVSWTLIRAIERMETFVEEIKDEPPLRQLEALMRHQIRNHLDEDGLPMNTISVHNVIDVTTHEKYKAHIHRMNTYLSELVKEAHANGDINPDLSPVVVIGSMFSLIHVLRSPEIMNDHSESLETISDGIITVYLHGVTPPQNT